MLSVIGLNVDSVMSIMAISVEVGVETDDSDTVEVTLVVTSVVTAVVKSVVSVPEFVVASLTEVVSNTSIIENVVPIVLVVSSVCTVLVVIEISTDVGSYVGVKVSSDVVL